MGTINDGSSVAEPEGDWLFGGDTHGQWFIVFPLHAVIPRHEVSTSDPSRGILIGGKYSFVFSCTVARFAGNGHR